MPVTWRRLGPWRLGRQGRVDSAGDPPARHRELDAAARCAGWYLPLVCEVEMATAPIAPTSDSVVGIELGLHDFVVTSDGERVPNPRPCGA